MCKYNVSRRVLSRADYSASREEKENWRGGKKREKGRGEHDEQREGRMASKVGTCRGSNWAKCEYGLG